MPVVPRTTIQYGISSSDPPPKQCPACVEAQLFEGGTRMPHSSVYSHTPLRPELADCISARQIVWKSTNKLSMAFNYGIPRPYMARSPCSKRFVQRTRLSTTSSLVPTAIHISHCPGTRHWSNYGQKEAMLINQIRRDGIHSQQTDASLILRKDS